jgi:sialate O-acetylesterase
MSLRKFVKIAKFVKITMCCALVVAWSALAEAALRLPSVLGDNMVLQRDAPLPIWGWATPGDQVTVSVAGQEATVKAGDDGRWRVTLAKLALSDKPLEMTIKDSSGSVLTLKNIAVGDVWVCSGQSNMEFGIGNVNNAKQEIADANYPQIRLFKVRKAKAAQPAFDCTGNWKPCSPTTVFPSDSTGWNGFSATAYFFGRSLNKELNIPIGLIDTSWGGTPIQAWSHNGELYNAMVAPLVPLAIRGAIWYQGEANIGQAYQYRTMLPTMIAQWRHDFGVGDFPFGVVQLAPFRYNKANPVLCAELWDAQLATLKSTKNVGLAVTTDIGNLKDIHPKNKQEVGRRLALWALAKNYGKDLVYSGPIYKAAAVDGNKIRVTFDNVGGGLKSADGKPLTEFTIAGADQKFVPAVAEIEGGAVVVHSDAVANPAAVRFGWHDSATPNFVNQEGLPASPFRTDAWKLVTQPK